MARSAPNKWLIFLLVAIAQFMVVLDISITNVALPSIKTGLQFSSDSALQWVITAYALTFGGFLLLGGRAADLFGRRRTLLIGMSCFTFISFLIGFSQSAPMLIGLRAIQGLAAALMSPSALSIVLSTFEEGAERSRALSYWSTVATGGASVGLLLGGALTQYFGWQWNFFINVPVGLVMLFLIWQKVPLHKSEAKYNDLDLPGAALVTTGLIALVYAISEAPYAGWLSEQTLATVALAVLLLSGFVWNESRSRHPLVPLSIFRIQNVSGANLMMAPVYASVLGVFFIATLYLQTTLHYSPVVTGLAFLPFPIALGSVSLLVPNWVSKFGYKPFLLAGPILVAAGLLWFTRLPVHGMYVTDLLPTLILMPAGIGMTFMPLIAAATSGVPASEGGLASGMITTSQQMGGAVGLSILSGIVTGAAKSGGVSGLVQSYHEAFGTAVVFACFALLVAATVIREKKGQTSAAHYVTD